jgi:hypothetical protein
VKREIARRWVEALRSGEYDQTRGALQRQEPDEDGNPVGFCCLGVLCELAVEEKVIGSPTIGQGWVGYGRCDHTSLLPDPDAEWAGFTCSDPELKVGGTTKTASYLNDEDRLTFADLAEVIERNFLQPKEGDKVLLPIGSWYKGRFIDRDREVEGEVVVRYDDGSLLVRTDHGQKPNGCQTEQTVHRTSDEVKLVEEAGV